MDFFTADVWTARGLVTHYVLFVIHHASRMVEIVGITPSPNGEFMAQVARNLTDPVDGFLRAMRYLILDRDAKFTDQFQRILKDAGVKSLTAARSSPTSDSTGCCAATATRPDGHSPIAIPGIEPAARPPACPLG